MEGETNGMKLPRQIEATFTEIPWTRSVAAGSLIVGALLLISGKRRSGIAVAAAGAAVALLEDPQAVRSVWDSMPRYVRSGQDFMLRLEDFVDELNKQGIRLRKVLTPQ
jgi:hypothetical protein